MRWCLIDFGRISYSLLPSWFLWDFPGKSNSTHILISFLWLNHVEGNVNNPITLIILSFPFFLVFPPKNKAGIGWHSLSFIGLFRSCDVFIKCHHAPNYSSDENISAVNLTNIVPSSLHSCYAFPLFPSSCWAYKPRMKAWGNKIIVISLLKTSTRSLIWTTVQLILLWNWPLSFWSHLDMFKGWYIKVQMLLTPVLVLYLQNHADSFEVFTGRSCRLFNTAGSQFCSSCTLQQIADENKK